MSKHYDVVVVGRSLGALATAALLSRRSWRVLVIGHGARPQRYEWEGLPFARRGHTFVAGATPVWRRIVAELAQTQTLKRRTHPRDPMFQFLTSDLALDVPPDGARFSLELGREFAEQRRSIEDFYAELSRFTAECDAALEEELVLPPATFWERREANRVLGKLSHIDKESVPLSSLFVLPDAIQEMVRGTVAFASSMSGELPLFATLRLHASYTRGISDFPSGEDELTEFLVERIRAHGGDVELGERVENVDVTRGAISSVKSSGTDARIGVGFLVTDMTAAQLLLLARVEPSLRGGERGAQVLGAEQIFVTSVLVKSSGLPKPLCREAFLLPPLGSGLPRVRLHREPVDVSRELLVLEAIEFERQRPIGKLRESVLLTLMHFFPFMSGHFIAVDSVHDGLPLWDYRSESRVEVPRTMVKSGATPQAEPMESRFRVNGAHLFGLAAEPVRAPLSRAFLVGPSVLPALGQEGELLAATSVARLINRTDRQKERMRREMWSKIELP